MTALSGFLRVTGSVYMGLGLTFQYHASIIPTCSPPADIAHQQYNQRTLEA